MTAPKEPHTNPEEATTSQQESSQADTSTEGEASVQSEAAVPSGVAPQADASTEAEVSSEVEALASASGVLSWRSAGLGIVALFVATFAWLAVLEDPALLPGTFRSADNRRHRYGAWPYQRTQQAIEGLRKQRAKARDNEQKAMISAQLADVFMARKMLSSAYKEIQAAKRYAPRQAEVLMRHAMICHYLKRREEARKSIRQALKLAPRHPQLQRAARMILRR